MAKLGNLYIQLIADTATFTSGLNKAKSDLSSSAAVMNRALATVDKQFQGLGHSIKDVGAEFFSLRGAATALFGVIGAGSIIELSKEALEAVGGLGELSSQIGVTTETLQTFRYAASQVGVSQDEMDASLAKLTKTIGLAAGGNKAAIDSFNQFGIKILDAQGKVRPTDDIIRDMADTMARLPDPAQRAALATELMGRAGQKLIPFLQDGSRGIAELIEKAKALGLVFDEETIAKADKAADTLATLSTVLKTNFQGALVQLAPYMTDFANALITITGKTQELLKYSATLPLEASLHNLKDAQEKFAGDQAEFAKDPENAYNVYGITQESLRAAEADIKKQIQDIRDYAQKYGLTDYPGVPPVEGGRHSAVKPSIPTGPTVGASNPLPTQTGKSEAEKNIDKLTAKLRELQDQLAALDDQAQGTTLSKAFAGLDPDAKGAEALAVQIAAVADEIDRAKLADEAFAAQQKADADAVQEWNAEMADGKQLVESLRTPMEVYLDTLARLRQLQKDGAISNDAYVRGLAEAKQALQETSDKTSGLKDAMTELGSTWTSAFEDAALSMDDAGFSIKSLSDLLKGLLQDIERILLRVGVESPITKGIEGFDWSSLFSGTSPGAQNQGPAGHASNTGGGFFSFLSGLFHSGGIAGQGGGARRSVPSFAFAGAPRLHSGGFIGPGEVPAILKRGEGVFTAAQMANMAPAGGGDINVVVNNMTGVDADGKAETTTGLDGQKQLMITLEKKLASSVRQGGPLGRAVLDTVGAQRVASVQRS